MLGFGLGEAELGVSAEQWLKCSARAKRQQVLSQSLLQACFPLLDWTMQQQRQPQLAVLTGLIAAH